MRHPIRNCAVALAIGGGVLAMHLAFHPEPKARVPLIDPHSLRASPFYQRFFQSAPRGRGRPPAPYVFFAEAKSPSLPSAQPSDSMPLGAVPSGFPRMPLRPLDADFPSTSHFKSYMASDSELQAAAKSGDSNVTAMRNAGILLWKIQQREWQDQHGLSPLRPKLPAQKI